jgi:DNA-binding response OmpR family regulator
MAPATPRSLEVKKTEPVGHNPRQKITVLSVGQTDEDHAALSGILATAEWPLCPDAEWTIETTPTIAGALSTLQKKAPPLLLCESDLEAGSWRELWDRASVVPDPPFLIVTSRLADEYLWAEALNLGAYDVLAKPFEPIEVVRTLSQAWLHRCSRRTRQQRNLMVVGHPMDASGSRVAV